MLALWEIQVRQNIDHCCSLNIQTALHLRRLVLIRVLITLQRAICAVPLLSLGHWERIVSVMIELH
jgi:hypothetical protein